MAVFEELKAGIDSVGTRLGEVEVKLLAKLATLADEIAKLEAGSPVSQEQIDSLDASFQAVKDVTAKLESDVG